MDEDVSVPFIQLNNVSKVYHMGETDVAALSGVTLTIDEDSFTVVVGRSGSGKSTLLHLLAAMDVPTAGEITVGSRQITIMDSRERTRFRRGTIGMIFQEFNLIPTMTALGNVELPLLLAGIPIESRRRRAQQCLDQVGLSQRSGHRPKELSGGEQQRVAIARALVHDPPVLLADEPTGNLDSDTAKEILNHLGQIKRAQNKTIILVTHSLSEVREYTERVIHLHDGVVVDDEFC